MADKINKDTEPQSGNATQNAMMIDDDIYFSNQQVIIPVKEEADSRG